MRHSPEKPMQAASPRLYLQVALFRTQTERGEKNQCWLSPSLQIQLYVWHRKLTKNCNLEKNSTLGTYTDSCKANWVFVLSQTVSSHPWTRIQNISKWYFPGRYQGLHISLLPHILKTIQTILSKRHICGTHTRLCEGNTDRSKVSLAGFRKEKLTLNTNTLSRFQKQRLTSIAPSPSSFTPLLPKADLLLMKSLP